MATFQSLINAFVQWLDRFQRSHPPVAFLYAVLKKYTEDEAGHRAALLAYYGFLAIFPLLLVLTSMFNILLRNDAALGNQLMHGAVAYFPAIGRQLQDNIHGISKTGIALIVGIALTLFGARGVADVLRGSLDHIWNVSHARRSTFPLAIFRSMAIIVVGGFGLLLAPVVSSYALVFGKNWFSAALSAVVVTFVLFWVLVYVIKIGASAYRPFRDIWLGTLMAAISLEVLQLAGSFIMTRELQRLDDLYGTFALVLGLIFWIYLQTQVLLLMFEVDTVRVGRLWPRSMAAPLTEADRKAYELYSDRATFQNLS